MPIYEYRCQECGATFEALRKISDADHDIVCPHCQSVQVQRQVSSFAAGGCGSGSGASRGRFR